MKKLLLLCLLLSLNVAEAQLIRFNVTNNDPATGKRLKYTNVEVRVQYGMPIEFNGAMTVHEANDAPAIPLDTDARSKKLVEAVPDTYTTTDKNIDTVTKLYVIQNSESNWVYLVGGGAVSNPVASVGEYLRNKAINSFPGTAGSDSYLVLTTGLCREMIDIRKANGEFKP